jgi:putative PEP-CTERM system TPR-repeat lipoprotein
MTVGARIWVWFLLALGLACSSPERTKTEFVTSGDEYAAAGRYEEAVIQYRNALQSDPRAGDVRAKLAEAFMQTGDVASALGEYVRAADLLEADLGLQTKAGNLLLLAARFDDAKARADKVLATDPRNVDALVLAANALAGLKDPDAAVAQIEDALRVDPGRSGTYSSLGALELSRGKSEEAHAAFQKAVQLDPGSVAAHLALGNFYWLTERPVPAEQSLRRALELDPRNALTNRALANFYLATDQRDKAEEPLRAVFEITRTPASAFALSEYYVAVGKAAAARALLQPMLGDPRTSSEADVRLAALDYEDGNHDEAYRRLANVLTKDTSNLQALVVKGALLLSDGKLDEALAAATTAADRHPDSTAALFILGRVQTARKQPEAAIAAFQNVLRLNPRATDAKIALGRLYLAQGRPDTSMGFAVEALANEPANGDAQLLLVRGLLARGELDRAAGELNQLVARFPDSAVVRVQLGMLLGRQGNSEGARAEFERALSLQPEELEALGGLIALDLAGGDYASARARVDARVASKPTATLLTLAARTYAASGDLAAAERFLRRAIDLDNTFVAAYGALGQIFIVQGKHAAARAEFEALAQRSPDSIAALTMVGILLQAEGDVAGARQRYERVLQIDPDAAVAANNLAWLYAEHGGNLDVALGLAQTALKHLPDVAGVYDTLGFIYYKKNLASLAVSTLKVSVEKDPLNPLYHFHLAQAYASSGDSTQAKQSLTRVLDLKPDFQHAAEARALLASLEPARPGR